MIFFILRMSETLNLTFIIQELHLDTGDDVSGILFIEFLADDIALDLFVPS